MTIFYIATGWVDNYPNHNERSPYSAWGAKAEEFSSLVDFGEKESETMLRSFLCHGVHIHGKHLCNTYVSIAGERKDQHRTEKDPELNPQLPRPYISTKHCEIIQL